MSSINTRIEGFVKLGRFLSQFSVEGIKEKEGVLHNDIFFESFKNSIASAKQHNGWFTGENVLHALTQWSEALTHENIGKWLDAYEIKDIPAKKVAIVMAGNIPLVGLHDFMSVLLFGHAVTVKLSSNDKQLLPLLAKYLIYSCDDFKGKIEFTEEQLGPFDAAIATGSNNTARYFDYYFRKKPAIIRKNRNSVAVLTGKETTEQLNALGKDIFTYYGLGCRSVSKLFVPENYDFKDFFETIYDHHPIIEHTKYANNYDYNKAVYLMSLFNILENGFLMLKEDENYASPIATVFYERYSDLNTLKTKLEADKDKIQCIVAHNFSENEVAFGQTQHPQLWDYADGIDVIDFLLKI